MRRLTTIVLAGLLQAGTALGGIGDIDPAYGDQARVAAKLLPLDDGRALLFDIAASRYQRYDASGHADATFGDQGWRAVPAGFRASALAYLGNTYVWLRQADGSTLVGGTLIDGSQPGTAAIIRIDATGEFDPAFAGSGVLTLPDPQHSAVLSLALQTDGRLLVLIGNYRIYYMDGPTDVVVRRLDQLRAPDPTFGTQGVAPVLNYATYTDGRFSGGLEVEGQKLEVLLDGRIRISDSLTRVNATYFVKSYSMYVPYLDANGIAAAPPQPIAALDASISDWRMIRPLADGSVLLDGDVTTGSDAVASTYYKLVKVLPGGQPDPYFGAGGAFTVNGLKVAYSRLSKVSADGRYAFVAWHDSAGTAIVRILLDGATPGVADPTFGHAGKTAFGFDLGLTALQPLDDGSVLMVGDSETVRLSTTGLPGPGFITLDSTSKTVTGPGQVLLHARRLGGSLGIVSVDFNTVELAGGDAAVAGQDFAPNSGHIVWADGDIADKNITVAIYAGSTTSTIQQTRYFNVSLGNLAGGGWIEIPETTIGIVRSPAAAPSPPPSGDPSHSGDEVSSGGGSVDLLLLALLGLLCGNAIARRNAGSRTGRHGAARRT
jgi:hypothetical protein